MIYFFFGGGSGEDLKDYENYLNSLIPDIEVSLTSHSEQIPFLDTLIYKHQNTIQTKVYFKETDTHQLLHTQSYHPKHTFTGILKSQLIRFKRLSSSQTDYNFTCNTLYSYLKHRGYSSSTFRKLKHTIWHTNDLQTNKTTNTKLLIPIIMPHSSLGRELVQNYKSAITRNVRFKDHRPIAAFTVGRNLKSLLVRSKLSDLPITENNNNFNNRTGYKKCTSTRCNLCKYYTKETNLIQSTSTKQNFYIKHELTCTSKNVIYLLTCNKCKVQYVGETGQAARDRFNNHKSSINTNRATPVSVHFNSIPHEPSDLNFIPIEKLPNNNKTDRLRAEKIWTKRLRTFYPWGLNGLPMDQK